MTLDPFFLHVFGKRAAAHWMAEQGFSRRFPAIDNIAQ